MPKRRRWPVALLSFLFFVNDTATTEIYTLSLHDALPISVPGSAVRPILRRRRSMRPIPTAPRTARNRAGDPMRRCWTWRPASASTGRTHRLRRDRRSEEHTSELQSPDHLVCRLLLEKKTKNTKITQHTKYTKTKQKKNTNQQKK